MVTEHGRAELREFYIDPAQPLTIAVGQAFDLVSMPAAVGHTALAALCARRVRLGPVVADSRKSVMRVGRLGGALGVRVGGRGSTATLPPLLPWRGWLHWLVPPGGAAMLWTPAGALLSVLSERSGARAL